MEVISIFPYFPLKNISLNIFFYRKEEFNLSKNLQKLLQEALNNNSYDYSSMHLELKKTWENSFSYLYALQKSYIEYEENFYYSNNDVNRNSSHIGHLYLDKRNRAMFDVDYDLIHVTDREEYRTSKYYQKEMDVQDVLNNPSIFKKVPIIIIDDQVLWDYRLRVTKDVTNIVLPFKRNFVIEDKRNPNVNILQRGNSYTIKKDLSLTGTDATGDPLNLDILFLPAKVVKVRNVIMDALRQGKTISELNDEIDLLLYDYYTIDEIDDEHITFTAVEDDIVYKEHKIQVLIVDNLYYKRYRMHKNNLGLSTADNTIALRYTVLHDDYGVMVAPKQEGCYMVSFHFPNINGLGYELGTELIPAEKRDGYLYATISKSLADKLSNYDLTFFISIILIPRLKIHTFYTQRDYTTAEKITRTSLKTKLFVLEEENLKPYAMPIPVENMMIFREHDGQRQLIHNVDSVEMFYPNIYRIKDEEMQLGDKYQIFYYYYDGYDLHYTPVHQFYYEFLDDTFKRPIEAILNGLYWNEIDLKAYFTDAQAERFEKVFKKILLYKYYNHQYAEIDFLYRYTSEEGNDDKEPTEYKDETLRDWIKVEPFVLREYVLEQKHRGISHFLFTKTVNLDKRLRSSTAMEFPKDPTDFEEPRYVFAISNKTVYPQKLNCRVFVDGLFVMNLYQERKDFLDYIYIPTSYVTKDSFIELEIFYEYTTKTTMRFNSLEDTKTISILEPEKNISPTIADLVAINQDDQTTRYDNHFFDITAHYSRGDFPVKPVAKDKPIRFTRLTNFTIKPNDEAVLNIPFDVYLSKISSGELYKVKKPGYQMFSLVSDVFGFSTEYVRIFHNGRLLPRGRYFINTLYNYPIVFLMDECKVGDEYYIDITPYRYKQIYYQEELTDKTTLIDLKDVITKPFDIRYYDVYLNGRRLNITNAFVVDPWSMTLTNLKSKYNLTIFEKDRDYEYFGLNYKENQYYFSYEELFKEPFVSEDERNTMIKRLIDAAKDERTTIKPNTNEEEKEDNRDISIYIRIYSFYHDELIPKTYLNPDEKQTSYDVMQELYYPIYDEYLTSPYMETKDPIDKERRKDYTEVINLNPDVSLTQSEIKNRQLVYSVGHLYNVEQEKLDTKVTIPGKRLITGGEDYANDSN